MTSHHPGRAIRTAMTATIFGLAAAQAFAAAPMAKTPAPGYYRFMLGGFEVTALSDGTVDLPVDQLLHEPAAKTVAALNHAFQKTPQETSDNAYLINTGKRLILIDTGAGDLFGPTLGKLMGNLKASGYSAADVDDLVNHHCLTLASPPPPGWWCFAGFHRNTAIPVRGTLRSDDTEALLEAAVAGIGIVHLASWMVGDLVRAGKLVALFPDLPALSTSGPAIHAVRMPGRSHTAKARLFIDHLKNSFGEPPYWDGF